MSTKQAKIMMGSLYSAQEMPYFAFLCYHESVCSLYIFFFYTFNVNLF